MTVVLAYEVPWQADTYPWFEDFKEACRDVAEDVLEPAKKICAELPTGNRKRRGGDMFKTIVLGLDGSDGARRAFPFATELARRDNARIVIAHVEERIVGKGGGPLHADEEEVVADIRRQADELSSQGIDTSVETSTVMLGGPAHSIDAIADKVGADLIVVGTRGHSPVAGLLLGSVTQRLLHVASTPVLAVPPAARSATEEARTTDG